MAFKIEPITFPIVPTYIDCTEDSVAEAVAELEAAAEENPFTKMQEEIDALSAKVAALEAA